MPMLVTDAMKDSALLTVSNNLHIDLADVERRRRELEMEMRDLLEKRLRIERDISAIRTVRENA